MTILKRSSDFSCRKRFTTVGDALQWRKGHPHRIGAHVGARQSLGVDVCRWLFIEPNPVKRLALEFFPA